MRYFNLLNIQHFVLYFFPAFITLLLIAIALKFSYFHSKDSEEKLTRITHRYPLGIEERDAPFPLVLLLIILGTVIWVFGYILMIGLLGIKI
jgi:hypothetical protein